MQRDYAAVSEPVEPDGPEDLAEWAADALRKAANRFVSYGVGTSFGKRDVVDRPQLTVLLALQRRLGISSVHKLVKYLAAHPELLERLGLDRAPRSSEIFAARRKLLTLNFTAPSRTGR